MVMLWCLCRSRSRSRSRSGSRGRSRWVSSARRLMVDGCVSWLWFGYVNVPSCGTDVTLFSSGLDRWAGPSLDLRPEGESPQDSFGLSRLWLLPAASRSASKTQSDLKHVYFASAVISASMSASQISRCFVLLDWLTVTSTVASRDRV